MDAGTIIGFIGAGVAVFGLIGGVVKWATDRFNLLQRQLSKLEHDYTALHREHTLVLVKLERTRLAFQMVATELARKSPGNNALALAKALLDEAFKVDPDLPRDMQDKLAEIDRVTSGDD